MTQPASSARKKPSLSRAALYRNAEKELTRILTLVLKTPSLRKRTGIELKKSGTVSLGLDVSFVSAEDMRSLNRKFRRKNRPTDVLSFPAPDVFVAQGHLGDLIICAEVMKKQAAEEGHSVLQELRILLVHGVLHLLDFDHERGPKEAKRMADQERQLLGDLGLIERSRRS